MSKRMVDLKVQDGNVASIDGYKVGGGGDITGEALMNATKDSTTITRTLDTDGKVKFESLPLKHIDKEIGITIEPKEYHIGDMIKAIDINVGKGSPVSVIPPAAQNINEINFIGTYYRTYANEVRIAFICIKGGVLAEEKSIVSSTTCWYV